MRLTRIRCRSSEWNSQFLAELVKIKLAEIKNLARERPPDKNRAVENCEFRPENFANENIFKKLLNFN